MKKFLLLVLLSGCYAHFGSNPPAPNNYRDDVFCWHKNPNNTWEVQGLAESCPLGAEYGE